MTGPELDSENEHKAITVAHAMQTLPPNARPVMVGDRKHDIAAAHEHHIRAIGVLWGIGSEDELLTAGADALARTPTALETLLTRSALWQVKPAGGASAVETPRK